MTTLAQQSKIHLIVLPTNVLLPDQLHSTSLNKKRVTVGSEIVILTIFKSVYDRDDLPPIKTLFYLQDVF